MRKMHQVKRLFGINECPNHEPAAKQNTTTDNKAANIDSSHQQITNTTLNRPPTSTLTDEHYIHQKEMTSLHSKIDSLNNQLYDQFDYIENGLPPLIKQILKGDLTFKIQG